MYEKRTQNMTNSKLKTHQRVDAVLFIYT